MIGAIRKRDIIAHPFVTVSCFGWRVFLRAVAAGPGETFLSIVAQTEVVRPHPDMALDVVRRCVELELRAKRIYEFMAHRFHVQAEADEFFSNLAVQEQEHASLLQLCSAAAERSRWIEECLVPLHDALHQLEEGMGEAELSLETLDSLADALRLVIAIESSEVNQVFQGVLSATRSEFVARLRAFQEATTRHLTYICQGIRKLEPTLQPDCEEMLMSHRASLVG